MPEPPLWGSGTPAPVLSASASLSGGPCCLHCPDGEAEAQGNRGTGPRRWDVSWNKQDCCCLPGVSSVLCCHVLSHLCVCSNEAPGLQPALGSARGFQMPEERRETSSPSHEPDLGCFYWIWENTWCLLWAVRTLEPALPWIMFPIALATQDRKLWLLHHRVLCTMYTKGQKENAALRTCERSHSIPGFKSCIKTILFRGLLNILEFAFWTCYTSQKISMALSQQTL